MQRTRKRLREPHPFFGRNRCIDPNGRREGNYRSGGDSPDGSAHNRGRAQGGGFGTRVGSQGGRVPHAAGWTGESRSQCDGSHGAAAAAGGMESEEDEAFLNSSGRGEADRIGHGEWQEEAEEFLNVRP